MEIKFENGSKVIMSEDVIEEPIRGTTAFFENSIKCLDCEAELEVIKGSFGHTVTVICKTCKQSWTSLIENLEELFKSKIV